MTPAVPAPCACTALRKAARAVSRFYDEALASAGLTTAQFAVLRHISRLEGARLSQLADALVMDRTSLYRALKPMVREGWIAIESGPGRSKTARITDRGQALMAAATPAWQAAQDDFVRRFGPDAWAGVSDGLQRAVLLLNP